MWLTVIFPDLCICTYILTPTPPIAHARPPLLMQICALCNVMTQVKAEMMPHIHRHTEGINNIKHLLVYDNCYAISCHHLWCSNWGSFHTEGVLQSRCSFIPPPIEDGHVTYPQAVYTLALCVAVVCQWSIEVSNIGHATYTKYMTIMQHKW